MPVFVNETSIIYEINISFVQNEFMAVIYELLWERIYFALVKGKGLDMVILFDCCPF